MISTFDQHHANFWRITGSSALPYSRANSRRRSSSVRYMIGVVAAASPRS
jgi:hypothetical protein